MDLRERTSDVVALMKKVKQDWVDSGPENPDLGIYLHFFRGDEVVAAAQCPLDRDVGLQAGQVGAMGFSATTMAMTFESYHSTLEKSPVTGERWQHQEMQFVAETHPDNDKEGWVNSCLTTSIHERGGGYILSSLPYRLVDGKLEWLDDLVIEVASATPEEKGAGVMFSYLQAAMAQPTMEEQIAESIKTDEMAKAISGLITDTEQREFHSDMATFRTLQERDLVTAVVFSAISGSDRERWLAERFGASDPE